MSPGMGNSLTKDSSLVPIQNPNGFAFVDASASPLTSPIASATSEITITFPANATSVLLYLPDNAGELRKVAGGATGGKFPIAAATAFVANGKGGDVFYVGRASASACYFIFDTVG